MLEPEISLKEMNEPKKWIKGETINWENVQVFFEGKKQTKISCDCAAHWQKSCLLVFFCACKTVLLTYF